MPAELPKQVSIISVSNGFLGFVPEQDETFLQGSVRLNTCTDPVCRNLPPTAGIQDCRDDCARKRPLASCGHPAICGYLNFSKPCPAPAVLWNRVAKGDELRAGCPDKPFAHCLDVRKPSAFASIACTGINTFTIDWFIHRENAVLLANRVKIRAVRDE